MKYPTISTISNLGEVNATGLLNIITNSIEYVYDAETVYDDFTKEDINKFVESLSKEQFNKVSEFFNTMPSSRIIVEYVCEGCGEKIETLVSVFESFFS